LPADDGRAGGWIQMNAVEFVVHRWWRQNRGSTLWSMAPLRAAALCTLIGFAAHAQTPEELRQEPRVRVGIGAGAMGGVASPAAAAAPGVTGDIGVVFSDRLAVTAHLSFATIVILTLASASAGVEYALSDLVSLGLGAGVAQVGGVLLAEQPWSTALVFPLRLALRTADRSPDDRWRRGLLVALEVSPGVAFRGMYAGKVAPGAPVPPPGFAITGSVSVGYALF